MFDFSGYNTADVIVLAVIACFALVSAKQGLLKSVLNLSSDVVSITASRILYPGITKALTATFIYEKMKDAVTENLHTYVISSQSQKFETEMIKSLSIPSVLKTGLIENNNSEIYRLLDVSSMEEYIGGYIAMVIINIIALILFYIVIRVLIKAAFKRLNMFSKLPVIRNADRLCGAVLGILWGIVLIWLVMCFITLFLASPEFSFISEMIAESKLAVKLYEGNIILDMINRIIV